MSEFIAYLVICFVAGCGVAARSGWIVGLCLTAAWWLGRAYG